MKQTKLFTLKETLITFLISSLIFTSISSIHIVSRHLGITKEVMLSIIYASYISHIILYLLELPPVQMVLSLSVQILLHRLLGTYPFINTKSFSFYYACCAFAVNKVLILLFILNSRLGVTESILCFLICSLGPLTIFYYSGGFSGPIKA